MVIGYAFFKCEFNRTSFMSVIVDVSDTDIAAYTATNQKKMHA